MLNCKKAEPILVVGSVALDTVQTPFGQAKEVLGGSATYFALAASLFTPVRLLSVVGQDFPRKYLRRLQLHSIDLAGLQVLPGKTFRWTGRYRENMNEAETLSVCQNVLGQFPEIPAHYRESRFVFLANTDPLTQLKTLEAIEAPQMVACDTMNLWIRTQKTVLKKLLRKVNILIVNDSEARMLTGKVNLPTAVWALLAHGPKTVIVKKGEHGVFLCTNGELFAVPAYPLHQVVDPTGAGDSFAGGFLGYLASQPRFTPREIRRATVYGTVVASFTVEDFSTRRLEKITLKDVETRFQEMKRILKF
ncbi:MAG: PfkB family carbohydrate kinase [Candidatus Omnitrophica bacterium]|nr:PfkB family carbohydrate kinase [Candidatus Omnitrophota bacterium]MCM8769063.1 PfkB family carbohydrate kinase [Candidatus Omnitrophota bacterium]